MGLDPSPYVDFWLDMEEEGYVKGTVKTKNEWTQIKSSGHSS